MYKRLKHGGPPEIRTLWFVSISDVN